MTTLFNYPTEPHVRKHGPAGYTNYQSYKPWLRDEFTFRCVYCLVRERWYPDGENSFAVDHLRPQSLAPELICDYDNLVYACNSCNSMRGVDSVPAPESVASGDLLRIDAEGRAIADSDAGEELISICRLNRPNLIEFRRGIIEVIRLLKERGDSIWNRVLGFPTALPNLASLRPPQGNMRPAGLRTAYSEVRDQGKLPETC